MILIFNPTNLDEVCVQDMNIESKGKNVHDVPSADSSQEKEGKEKGKREHAATTRKEEDRPTCLHCQKKGHEEERCWVLHTKLKPKWFQDKKGKKNP